MIITYTVYCKIMLNKDVMINSPHNKPQNHLSITLSELLFIHTTVGIASSQDNDFLWVLQSGKEAFLGIYILNSK